MFDGTLSTWKTYLVDFKLKDNIKEICSKTCPVPKVHKKKFKKEVEDLVLLIVFEK